MVDKVTPSFPAGYYPSDQTVSWTFDASVSQVAYAINGLAPSISQYIAYDTLSPPTPFIATTQDGKGNVVYDGGFIKFYNTKAPAAGAKFADLTPSFKYLYNALNFVANAAKVAAGNKRVLVLGDQAVTVDKYTVKGEGTISFKTSIINLCAAAGFTPTIKDVLDYTGTQLNQTLAELDQYCAVILFSTATAANNEPLITDNAIADMVTYRSQGNGMIFITDHGSRVQTDINKVTTAEGAGFYGTANRVMVNFGAFFTGNYDRSPVNVGFLRATYGDHPLYAGMADTDDIEAGPSESRVVVTSAQLLTPTAVKPVTFTKGANKINWLLKLKDGSIATSTFIYNIDTGEIILFKDAQGNAANAVDVGWNYKAKPLIELVGAGLGTLKGSVYLNDVKVAESYFDAAGGTKLLWFAGIDGITVRNGDTLKATIDVPFAYARSVRVLRKEANLRPLVGYAEVAKVLHALQPTELRQAVVKQAMANIQPYYSSVYSAGTARNLTFLRDYFENKFPLGDVTLNAYTNAADLQNALATITPPSTKQIFDTWARFEGENLYPSGTTPGGEAAAWYWDDAQQSAVQPNNTAAYVGFISNYAVENYDLEVTLRSTDGDDDFITVVLAYVRSAAVGLNHTLNLTLTAGANGWAGRPGKWPAITLNTDTQSVGLWNNQTGRYKEFATYQGEAISGWSGRYRKVKISRKGDQFVIQLSDWNSDVYNPALTMSLNLNADAILTQFKGPRPYGFGTYSQAKATFTNLSVQDGYRWDIILDIPNNKVYRYMNGAWALVEGVTIHQVFGAPRVIRTISGDKAYRLNADGSISTIS